MAFVDKSRVEPTLFFIEKISFSLKLFSGHFYGQSFIKTVRGPLKKKSMLFLPLPLQYLQYVKRSIGWQTFFINFLYEK